MNVLSGAVSENGSQSTFDEVWACKLRRGIGAKTQSGKKRCSEDKATDFEANDDFHDKSLLSFFKQKDGTARCQKRCFYIKDR
jgi:hypothetical protein